MPENPEAVGPDGTRVVYKPKSSDITEELLKEQDFMGTGDGQPRLARLRVLPLATIGASALVLLGACSSARASAELFASICSGCHNDKIHPKALVWNAAGNASIIEQVNALGMGAEGSLADHTAIATWMDSVKPTITLAPIPHDSSGTVIPLWDIIVSGATDHKDWKMIASIANVSPPTKGKVAYKFKNGFGNPSYVTYTPFPGQSGVDTWTYQGTGPGGATTIRTASVVIADGPGAAANYQGLWWAAPVASEDGWGINFAHRGNVIFGTWFTYDATGKGWWLTLITNGNPSPGVYNADLFAVTGPPFNTVPFVQPPGSATRIGSATLTFTDSNNGAFHYDVNLPGGTVSQTKAITQQQLAGPPAATCATGKTLDDLAAATNYQDIWWAGTSTSSPTESGWGINFTHQGDNVFASWFTYDLDGTPLWLVGTTQKTAPGVYKGAIYRPSGPRFDAYDKSQFKANPSVGNVTLTFSDGNNATFDYTVQLAGMAGPVTQKKTITRQPFGGAGTACY